MNDRSRLRLIVLGVLVISLVGTLIGRLWYLQVLNAPAYRAIATSNQTHDIVTPAPRGEILDDKGRPLVDNKTALVISVSRTTLEDQSDGGKAVLQRLSKVIGTPYGRLNRETTPCAYKTVNKVVTASPNGCWNGVPYQPIPVSEAKPNAASTMRAFAIQERQEKFQGVSAELTAVRNYPKPDGALAAPILGYTNKISSEQLAKLPANQRSAALNSQVGAAGLEASYNSYLSGKPGEKQVTVDHLGAVTGTVKTVLPTAGDDLVTNIDAKAQATLETQLQDALDTARHHGYKADYDAGVVMNVRTGGIVAMASNPSYDPSKPPTAYKSVKKYDAYQNSKGLPFVDKAFGSVNPPGSTFKPIVASGLIADGTMTTGQDYECPSNFQGRHNFDGEDGLGSISLSTALIVSCDTFFFRLGFADWVTDNNLIKAGKKPREGVQAMAKAYGIGVSPGLDIPGAQSGYIANRVSQKARWEELKKNYCEGAARRVKGTQLQLDDEDYCKTGYVFRSGDQENEDLGQGDDLVSPLQLAVAYSAIANGGTVFEPRIVKAIMSPTGQLIKRIKAPVRDHIPLPAADLQYLRTALYGVTTSTSPLGTGTAAFAGFPMNKVQVGGKTGTAELSGTNEDGAWFASFGGPAGRSPQYVTVIEVDKADQGAKSAAPYVRNMWDSLYGLNGATAIFKNGVPPTKLPKVGPAAARARALRQAARRAHQNQQPTQGESPSPGSTPSSGSTPTPGSTPTSTAGSTPPSTTADGLPPGLEPIIRRRGLP